MQETIEYKSYVIKILPEESVIHPYDEQDMLTEVVTWMSRYEFSAKGAYVDRARSWKFYSSPNEIATALKSGELVYAAPLYAYIHSGITVNLGEMAWHWPDKLWDCGLAGFVYVTRIKAKREFPELFNRLGRVRSKERLAQECERIAKSETKILNQWLTGDVWMYAIVNANGDSVDSCGWMYGYSYCEAEAKQMVDYLAEKAGKETACIAQ